MRDELKIDEDQMQRDLEALSAACDVSDLTIDEDAMQRELKELMASLERVDEPLDLKKLGVQTYQEWKAGGFPTEPVLSDEDRAALASLEKRALASPDSDEAALLREVRAFYKRSAQTLKALRGL